MSKAEDADILLIADSRALLGALDASIQSGEKMRLSGILWSQTPSLLRPELLRSSSLVVVELFRQYQHGKRAEGVVLAERWAGVTPFLIVAPRFWANEIDCPGYWDAASEDSIGERVRWLLANPEAAAENFDQLKERMRQYLAVPRQH